MQLRRIWEGAITSVQLNIGFGWIDVREILTRLSLPLAENNLANWSSNLVALLGAPQIFVPTLAGAARQLDPNIRETDTVIIPFEPRSFHELSLQHAVLSNALSQGLCLSYEPTIQPFVQVSKDTAVAPQMLRPPNCMA